MDVKLRQLRYFKAVVEHGTIAAAAQALHIAQPPLSKQIRQLEADAGVDLFERVNHRLQLRDEGRYLYELACELLTLADDVDNKMRALAAGTGGTVRVGTTAAGVEPAARAAAALNAAHPAMHFVCWQAEPLALQRMVAARSLDVAIVPRPVETSGLVSETLVPLRYVALSVPDIMLPDTLDLPTLACHPLLLLHRDSRFGSFERLLDVFHARELAPRIVAECSDVPVLLSLARRGVGIGLLAVNAAEPMADLPAGLACCEVTGLPETDAELVAIRKGGVTHAPGVERFLQHLRNEPAV